MTLIISQNDSAFCNPTGKICASTDGQKRKTEDRALNGLSWLCWVVLITVYIFVSFKVFVSNDTLKIHLLFSTFQIYSKYIFKEHATLTFTVWAQIYAPWNTCLCNFGLCISGLFVEGVWIQTSLFIASSCLICKHVQAATCFKAAVGRRGTGFSAWSREYEMRKCGQNKFCDKKETMYHM